MLLTRPVAILIGLPVFACLLLAGCFESPDAKESVLVYGKRGLSDGRFQKPRAISVDADNEIYVVDMTARIQVFDANGVYLRSWRTPEFINGKPCGLSFSNDGLLMVADTHYFRVLFYTTQGEPVPERTIGGTNGRGPGEFGFVTDAVQDSRGNYYVAEYGDYDRIQKFDSSGHFLFQWGGHGTEPGQFLRPQGLAVDRRDRIWVADASNHRIQVFDATGDHAKLVKLWGQPGSDPGFLRYPYDLWIDDQNQIFVAEFGNHRIQKFTADGVSLGVWGGPGRAVGQLHQPWGMCLDRRGMIHVLDSYNHRIQRFAWPENATQQIRQQAGD